MRSVCIREDAEHKQKDFSGQPSASFRVMGRIFADTLLVRLADTEAEACDKTLNNAALSQWAMARHRYGQFWIEMWSERLSNWVEV